jgi:hypothetical protein
MPWNIHRNELILSDHEHAIVRSRILKRRQKKINDSEMKNRKKKKKSKKRRNRMEAIRELTDRENGRK